MKVLKISKVQGFVWKIMQALLDGKSCFSHTNASNFRRPLQSLLSSYTSSPLPIFTEGGGTSVHRLLKMLRLPNFNMLFQLVLRKFFKSELSSYLLKVDHVIKSCKEPSC